MTLKTAPESARIFIEDPWSTFDASPDLAKLERALAQETLDRLPEVANLTEITEIAEEQARNIVRLNYGIGASALELESAVIADVTRATSPTSVEKPIDPIGEILDQAANIFSKPEDSKAIEKQFSEMSFSERRQSRRRAARTGKVSAKDF